MRSDVRLQKTAIDLNKLAGPEDLPYISPVLYAHDSVPKVPKFVAFLPAEVSRIHELREEDGMRRNGLRLYPLAANLPYRCTLDAVYESRFWKESLNASIKLLELLANDYSTADIAVGNGVTLAGLARKELRPGLGYRFNKATTYMYPFAEEGRIELLAAMMVMQFVFDDKCEETSESTIKPFVDDFVHRLHNDEYTDKIRSELQQYIDHIMQSYKKADAALGNGGQEVINTMSKAFRRVRPDKEFQTVREYLDFRHDNVGAYFVLASVKFSIASDVEIQDPKLAKFLSLARDHFAIVNDLASFDKELRDFQIGASQDMINVVDVFRRLLSLQDEEAAKGLAYAYQLQSEEWMKEELERFRMKDDLSKKQWRFIEAVVACAAGNAFYSMVSCRYGGEGAKIQSDETMIVNCESRRQSSEFVADCM